MSYRAADPVPWGSPLLHSLLKRTAAAKSSLLKATPLKLVAGAIVAAGFLFSPQPAEALPSFASQTGQPCTACHIGAFGPQLTPFGRAFKIGGYTQEGGEGLAAKIPLSAMLLGSFNNTGSSVPDGYQPQHYGTNNNFAMDQISVFLAGRVNDYMGGFMQGTFNGIDSTFKLDNTDLRLTMPFDYKDTEVRVGLTVNNGPTVQDPFNSTFAWGFPYVLSSFMPTPQAQPLLAGAMIGNTVGVTGYAWYDKSLYLEAGAYSSYGPTFLSMTGSTYPGNPMGGTSGLAPYLRGAYEWNWNQQSAHVGALFLYSDFNPETGDKGRSVDTTFGRNNYSDIAIDGGYQYLGDGTHVGSLYGIFVHEQQNLNGAFAAGSSSQASNSLNQVRLNASYFYQNTYGLTVAWQKTWGNQNMALYGATDPGTGLPPAVDGSLNGKPNSNAFIIEADWIPFGKSESWMGPWANLKLGAQYTIYTEFNGASQNYDGNGRNASANNTLYLFAWIAF